MDSQLRGREGQRDVREGAAGAVRPTAWVAGREGQRDVREGAAGAVRPTAWVAGREGQRDVRGGAAGAVRPGVRGEGVVGRESEGHLGRQSRHSRDPSMVTAIHGDLVVQDSFLVGVRHALTASSISAVQ